MAELTRQEFRAAILYDYKRGLSVDECCRSLKQHFGELRAPSRTTIFNRYRDFKTGPTCVDEVEDTATRMEARLLCKFVERVRELIRIDPSVSRLDIAKSFGLDLGFVETIVANALKLGQLNGQWVPLTLSESQRCLRADWASFMLDKFEGGSGPSANRIIACYHVWIYKCRTVRKSSRIASEYWTFEKSSRVVDKRMVICFFSRSGLGVVASVGNMRLLSPRNLIEGCLIDVIDEWSAESTGESVKEDRLFLYIETLAHSSARLLDFLYDRKVSLVALPECSADLQLGGSFLEPVFWTSVQRKRFPSHEDAVSAYKDCLNCAVPEMWHQLFDWWFRRIRKCLDGNGDYVEPIEYNTDMNDFDAASLMVNPNSVMPSHHSSVRTPPPSNTASSSTEQPSYTATSTTAGYSSQTTSGSKRHFNFSPKLSPKNEVPEVAEQNGLPDLEDGEAEASSDNDRGYVNERVYNNVRVYKKNRGYKNTNAVSEEEETEESEEEVRTLKATPQPHGLKLTIPSNGNRSKTTLLLPASTIKTISPQFLKTQQQQQQPTGALKLNGVTGIRLQNFKIVGQGSSNVQQLRRQIYNNNVQAQIVTQTHAQQQQQQQLLQQQLAAAAAAAAASSPVSARTKADKDVAPLLHRFTGKPYPKPAYSYSCLIAMALKNSQNGSLPVSEIYNFMCDHFPYFKTAPNGWKNSVRHNLSLNKCFEKIEKPAGNGNQRKGCLWAINPGKVAKMDEEVQKWSRKDPLAIKRAMIYPEHLELLERGEMKFAAHNTDGLSEETESSSGDEVEGSDGTVHSHQVSANSVTDSFDESSQDCDVDTSEHTYDEIDIDDNKESLHMQLNISKEDDYQLVTGAKRQKTITGTLQANYVYQPVTTARRKTPLTFLTTSAAAGSFLKLE